jgi:putative phage-type endonuclease
LCRALSSLLSLGCCSVAGEALMSTPLARLEGALAAIGPDGACTAETFPDREAWLAGRSSGIGGSDVATILGVSPWSSPYRLWAQRRGLVPAPIESEAMEWGLRLEGPIAEKYTDETKRALADIGRYTLLRSVRHPWLTCTLDRVILPIDERGPGVLEIKAVNLRKIDDWDKGPPLHYLAQLQAQLAVTGWQWGSLAVLVGGQKFLYVDIARDDAGIDAALAVCKEFWDLLQSGEAPEPDASEATTQTLRAMYATESGETVELPPEAGDWDREIAEAKQAARAAAARVRAAENKLLAALGAASCGVLPGGVGRYQYKQVTRRGYVVEPSTYRELRRLNK